MKELSIEEKAKAYDEAFKRASNLYKDAVEMENNMTTKTCEIIFPELSESEDERMVKFIKNQLFNIKKTITENYELDAKLTNAIDWLEKQADHAKFINSIQVGDKVTRNEDGMLVNLSQLNRVAKKNEKQSEQKSDDKVEPKFKVGDWIVFNGLTLYIKEVVKGYYRTITKDGITNSYDWDIDNAARLWTIQDAKDGEILATQDHILIFEKLLPKDGGVSYCHYDFGSSTPQFDFNKDDNWYFGKEAKVYPATKEQCDLLFQKMKEAGYEWDAEKKELKKIEQKPVEWSEEDENRRLSTIEDLEDYYDIQYNKPKGEWISIENRHNILNGINENINWLKSLRLQNRWKPSNEQIAAVKEAACYSSVFSGKTIDNLISLSKQLKKLREE